MHHFLYLLPLIFVIILRLIVWCLLRNRRLLTTVQSNYVADTQIWHPDSPLGLKDLFLYLLEVLLADSPQVSALARNCPWLSSHLVHGHDSFLGAAYIQWLVDMRHESTFCPNWGQLRGPSSFRVLCGADWGPCRNCITAPIPVFFLPFLQKKGCSSDYSIKHSAHYCAPVHLNCLLEETSLESNKLLPFK